MNREITFRAWDKQEKQMVYGIEETYDGLPYSELNEKVELDIYNHMSCFSSWLFEDAELMQYIGIKDTNGNKIYERDIVEDEQGRRNLVVFKEGLFLIGNWNTHGFMNAFTEFRVIGNVFENPEMLEED